MFSYRSRKIELKTTPGNQVLPRLNVSQYDYGEEITFTMTDDTGMLWNSETYQTGETPTLTVHIIGRKKDGKAFEYECNHLDNPPGPGSQGSKYYNSFNITEQMTAVAGEVVCEMVAEFGRTSTAEGLPIKKATANFILDVEQSPVTADTPFSETDIPIIQKIPEILTEAQGYAESAAGSAEDAREAAASIDVEGIERDIELLEATVGDHNETILAMQRDVTNLHGDVGGLQEAYESLGIVLRDPIPYPFEWLPYPWDVPAGATYKVLNAFTSDENFANPGKSYPANTVIYRTIDNASWDILGIADTEEIETRISDLIGLPLPWGSPNPIVPGITYYNCTGTSLSNELKCKISGDILTICGRLRFTISTRTGANPGVKVTIPINRTVSSPTSVSFNVNYSEYSDGLRNGEAIGISFDAAQRKNYFYIKVTETFANVATGKILVFAIPPTTIKLDKLN